MKPITQAELNLATTYGMSEAQYRQKRAAYKGPTELSLGVCAVGTQSKEHQISDLALLVHEVIAS